MKKACFVIVCLLLSYSLSAAGQVFSGKLDAKGRVIIKYALPADKPFLLQGFVYYNKNWRAMKLFWNKKVIWSDMGPDFKALKYRVHLNIP